MTRYTMALVLHISLPALLPMLPTAAAATEETRGEEEQQMVSGTLTQLDLVGMKGMLNTDLGQAIMFDITKQQLFEHLPLGSRVTIGMNNDGGADRVAGASMADVMPSAEQAHDRATPPLNR